MSNCTFNAIFANEITDKCQFALANCEYEYINYYFMHFCLFKANYLFTVPISIVFLTIFFLVISGVSNTFLSPSLTKIVDTFKISQNLAGVTLIALGNGAGDVISSIVASNCGEGIELALGGLLGSGMLLTSLVLGIIVYIGKTIKVNKPMFNRDIFLYIVALLILFAFSINMRIILIESCGFIGLYLLNVGIAFFQDWQNKKRNSLDSFEKKDLFNAKLDSLNISPKLEESFQSKEFFSQGKFNSKDKVDTYNTTLRFTESKSNEVTLTKYNENNKKEKEKKLISDENMESVISEIYAKKQKKACCTMCDNNYQLAKNHLKTHYSTYNDEEWEKISSFSKGFYLVIQCPINILCSMTIPSCEEKHWKRTKYVLMPISIFFFIFIAFKIYKMSLGLIILSLIGVGITLLFMLFWYCLPSEFPENKSILLSIISIVISLIWIWFISNNLISLLQMIGMLFKLPDAFLGITILACGNCVCDLSLNISLVKQGYGEMAVTSAIAGPLLNLLIGLGISLVKTNIIYGDIPFNVYTKETIITAVTVVFLFINLIRLVFQGSYLKYTLNSDISYCGFAMYLMFFIIACILTFI